MDKIKKILPPILTALMWASLVLLLSASISFIFGSKMFLPITVLGVVIMFLTNLIWYPTGVEYGEKTVKVYNNNLIYTNRANYIVEKQLFPELRGFCKESNKNFAIEIITHKIAKYQLKYEEYEKYCELKKKMRLSEENEKAFNDFCLEYTRKQLKLLEHFSENEPKFRKLEPDHIIKGHSVKSKNVPRNDEKFYVTIRIVAKIAWGLMLGVFTAAIVWRNKTFGLNEGIQLCLWTFSILWNIFSSIRSAYKSVTVNRNNYLVDKNDKCAEFFHYCNIEISEVDKQIEDRLKKEEPTKKEKVA